MRVKVRAWVLVLAIAAGSSRGVHAQEASLNIPGLGERVKDDAANQERSRMLGVLLYTNVSVQFDKTPVREAIHSLRQLLPVQIVGRYSDDVVGQGIDPDTPISLDATDQSALETLEAILKQCDGLEECTWQLRRGFVEIGTKRRLSMPAAQETRLYDISDLMIEPPTFSSDDDGMVRQFRKQFGGTPPGPARPGDQGSVRKLPMQIAVEIAGQVIENVEPGHWDYGQDAEHDPDADRVEPDVVDGERNAQGQPADSPPPATAPAAKPAPSPSKPAVAAPNDPIKAWARIRIWRQQLIIVAPDFVHRQVGGYPKPIRPTAEHGTAPAQLQPAAK